MVEASDDTTIDRKLSEIFGEAYSLYNSFETCNDPTNSPEFQANIKKCIKLFEDSTRLVSLCGLFSTNEKYSELPTDDLKYLMLPFFLGTLSQKLCGGSRAEIVDMSDVYFKDFLKRCADYEVYDENSNTTIANANSSTGGQAALAQMVTQRNQKLEKYRIKKELEDEVKKLKIVLEREHIDDETKRDFFVKLLKLSVLDAQEELSSITQEKQILEFQKMRQQMDPEGAKKPARRPPPPPLKPIIITKDLAQKAVYGLGYPSFPTMTVSEFYDQRVRDGIFPDPNAARNPSSHQAGDTAELEEQQDIDRELKLDVDDDYEVARLRARDEYKDDHRRGEGNRHNRS